MSAILLLAKTPTLPSFAHILKNSEHSCHCTHNQKLASQPQSPTNNNNSALNDQK